MILAIWWKLFIIFKVFPKITNLIIFNNLKIELIFYLNNKIIHFNILKILINIFIT